MSYNVQFLYAMSDYNIHTGTHNLLLSSGRTQRSILHALHQQRGETGDARVPAHVEPYLEREF